MVKEAWVGTSGTYRCIKCGEPLVSFFITYGEPATFEYPLFCPFHWREGFGFKNGVRTVLKWIGELGEEKVKELIIRLVDFIG